MIREVCGRLSALNEPGLETPDRPSTNLINKKSLYISVHYRSSVGLGVVDKMLRKACLVCAQPQDIWRRHVEEARIG